MRRRSRAGGEPVKAQRRKTLALKRSNARKVRGRGTPAHDQDTEIAIRERDEAREQQKATAEILRVIRTSPADVQPVFETIVRNAVTLCGSLYANVFRYDGELLHATSDLGHVWTAPSWQGFSSRVQHWSVQPCVRPLSAVHVTAGHNALRGSGPGQKDAFDDASPSIGY